MSVCILKKSILFNKMYLHFQNKTMHRIVLVCVATQFSNDPTVVSGRPRQGCHSPVSDCRPSRHSCPASCPAPPWRGSSSSASGGFYELQDGMLGWCIALCWLSRRWLSGELHQRRRHQVSGTVCGLYINDVKELALPLLVDYIKTKLISL